MLSCRQLTKLQELAKLVQLERNVILKRNYYNRGIIGNREVVGYGLNGSYSYYESTMFPFPAVRWMENTPEIMALREKEKGDWRKMTVEEKKALYRASFRQTFAEMDAPTGEWKIVFGMAFFLLGLGFWFAVVIFNTARTPLPETLTDPVRREHILRRMIDLRMNPIDGLSSKWDYENDRWK
ncbi:cytochrome c oxidase subunit 4 isoform 1, mitochondrial-like [Ctenocephalides felis]|uniref:cytochrome c oxidase subunit 4 isoform 1, mitochondrial-like n=1 Tax=Ctenocephalides felis TaxID=7515 RepID=UPI000E6E342F|nr:cytochrome c oxidase subunit 4 isoform 1, mitochondrial-like [Ctenocephalides felis]